MVCPTMIRHVKALPQRSCDAGSLKGRQTLSLPIMLGYFPLYPTSISGHRTLPPPTELLARNTDMSGASHFVTNPAPNCGVASPVAIDHDVANMATDAVRRSALYQCHVELSFA